jgi:GT2 family glycosyltransferase
MDISVLVPTYNRPEDLERCLKAVYRQTHMPKEVIITVRVDDDATHDLLARLLPQLPQSPAELILVDLHEPGVVAAMNKGIGVCTADIVAITDDDAEPFPDWLERLRARFMESNEVVGVGGRDLVYHNGTYQERKVKKVGKLLWYGKMIGNHHVGSGAPSEADFLKGVNCAYRTDKLKAIGFEKRLLGKGAQVHWELVLGLALRRMGGRLIYDPEIKVNHYEGKRHDVDQRQTFVHPVATKNMVHNETYAVLTHLKALQIFVFLSWAVLFGTTASPGLVQIVRYLLKGKGSVVPRSVYCFQGRVMGVQTWLKH